jgi:predicted nucleic-acid-binding protein
MIALDTNILARYLLNDDAKQGKTAAKLLSSDNVFAVPISALLELAWVLQANDCSRAEILKGLRHVLGLPNVYVRELETIGYALRWYEGGMDFADALHLAMSGKDERFVTFDRALQKQARKLGAFPPTVLAGG